MKSWSKIWLPLLVACLPAALVTVPHEWHYLPVHAALLGMVLASAWYGAWIEINLHDSIAYRTFLMLVVSLGLTWALYREAPSVNWWVIDDHEIHHLIGSQSRVSAAEGLGLMANHIEVCAPSWHHPRYRPAYYSLRILEAVVWGKDIQGWLFVRCGLFAFSLLLVFDLLRRWLGFASATMAVTMLSVLRMWPELVVRLGPSETYAAPACAAFAWCAAYILRNSSLPNRLAWVGLAASAIVAIGTKENFLILAPLSLLLAAHLRRNGHLRGTGVAAVASVCLAATLTSVVAVGIFNNGGRDIYQRSVGFTGLVNEGAANPAYLWLKFIVRSSPVFLLTGWLAIKSWRLRSSDSPQRIRFALGLVLALVALSQFYFYRGDVFRKNRYDLPYVPLVCMLAIGLLEYSSRRPVADPLRRRALRRLLVPGALAITAMAMGGDRTRLIAHEHSVATSLYASRLQAVVAACRQSEDRPIIFVVNQFVDFEAIVSVGRYLRSSNVSNPLHLRPVKHLEPNSLLDQHTLDFFNTASTQGTADGVFTACEPFPSDAKPIEVWFSKDPPAESVDAFRAH